MALWLFVSLVSFTHLKTVLIENCYLKGLDTWLPHAIQLLFVTTEVIATSLTLSDCANTVKDWEKLGAVIQLFN